MNLTYHEILTEPSRYRYSVTSHGLEAHLRILSEFQPSEEQPAPEVTFDDGHASNYRYSLPLLDRYSRRGMFFIVTGWIGARPQYMTWVQVREIFSLGHEVHSHSHTHPFLTHCSESELASELAGSKRLLEDKIGAPVTAISMPGGRWNARVLEACRRAGYKTVYSSDPWREPERRNGVQLIGRLSIPHNLDERELWRLLHLHGIDLLRAKLEWNARQLPKKIMGDRLYHRLWRLAAGAGNREEVVFDSRSHQ